VEDEEENDWCSRGGGGAEGGEGGVGGKELHRTYLLGSLVHLLLDDLELRVLGHFQGRRQWPGYSKG